MVKRIISTLVSVSIIFMLVFLQGPTTLAAGEFTDDFSTVSAWTQNTATISASNEIATITENDPSGSYGYVSCSVTVNLTDNPYIQINIPYLSFGGLWSLKVNDGGADIDVWNNSSRVAVLTKNLASLTGWSGNKTFTIKLLAVNEGQSFKADSIKIISNPVAVTYPYNGSTVNHEKIAVEGAGIPGGTATVYVDGVSKGSTTVDNDGFFVIGGITVSEASHNVYATCSSKTSPTIGVTYDKETVFYISVNPYNRLASWSDYESLNYDYRLTLGSIQGIVNKNGARLFVENSLNTHYTPQDTLWREYYTDKKNYTFVRLKTLEDVMHKFRYDVNGMTVYDNNRDASKAIAMTYAGLNNYVAVKDTMLTGEFKRLALQQNLRGDWQSDTSAYDWAQANLLPNTNDKAILSMGYNHDGIKINNDPVAYIQFDYGVQQQMFFFNLSPDTANYPADASRFTTIVQSMDEPGEVWGWAEPEWAVYNTLVCKEGSYIHVGNSNASFHAKVPCETTTFTQNPHKTTQNVTLENKYYVTFSQTEGDTLKSSMGMQFGDWVSPYRGEVVRNYGMNPAMSTRFPAVMEYYYNDNTNKVTANDYFYAGGGLGYVLLDEMAKSSGGMTKVTNYANAATTWLNNSDLKVTDTWENLTFHEPSVGVFLDNNGLWGSSSTPLLNDTAGTLSYTLSGKPVIMPPTTLHSWKVEL